MKTCFVDTNLFIRYLTNDDPVKADRVEKLLDEAIVT
jgi:predicted nucleic acid-binding protein